MRTRFTILTLLLIAAGCGGGGPGINVRNDTDVQLRCAFVHRLGETKYGTGWCTLNPGQQIRVMDMPEVLAWAAMASRVAKTESIQVALRR